MASFLITWNMFTIGQAVSASDNDQIKAAGRILCECETSVTSVCVATMLQKTIHT